MAAWVTGCQRDVTTVWSTFFFFTAPASRPSVVISDSKKQQQKTEMATAVQMAVHKCDNTVATSIILFSLWHDLFLYRDIGIILIYRLALLQRKASSSQILSISKQTTWHNQNTVNNCSRIYTESCINQRFTNFFQIWHSFIVIVFLSQHPSTTHWCFVSTCLSSLLWTIAAFNSFSLQTEHSQSISFKLYHILYSSPQSCWLVVYFDITASAPEYDNETRTQVWSLEKQWKEKKGCQMERHSSS